METTKLTGALILSMISLISVAALSVDALANGRETGNGGDACEKRIKEIRDNMHTWIDVGNFRALQFSANESVDLYKIKMLDAIDAAKISCVDETILMRVPGQRGQ